MEYYIFLQDGKLNGAGQCPILNEEIENIKVTEDVYNAFVENPDKYIYSDGEIIENPNYEDEKQAEEQERIARLKLTRGDVFRGLLQAKGITRSQIRKLIEAMPETTSYERTTKELALIDFDEALDFYRGNTLIDTLGEQLDISKTQLDEFFETNDYTVLLPVEEKISAGEAS